MNLAQLKDAKAHLTLVKWYGSPDYLSTNPYPDSFYERMGDYGDVEPLPLDHCPDLEFWDAEAYELWGAESYGEPEGPRYYDHCNQRITHDEHLVLKEFWVLDSD